MQLLVTLLTTCNGKRTTVFRNRLVNIDNEELTFDHLARGYIEVQEHKDSNSTEPILLQLFNNRNLTDDPITNINEQMVVSTITTFNSRCLRIIVPIPSTNIPSASSGGSPKLASIFTQRSQHKELPPQKTTENPQGLKTNSIIYNNLLDEFSRKGLGFVDGEWQVKARRRGGKHSNKEPGRGHAFMQILSDTLSYISQHIDTLIKRGVKISDWLKTCIVVKRGTLGTSKGKRKTKKEPLRTQTIKTMAYELWRKTDSALQRKMWKVSTLVYIWPLFIAFLLFDVLTHLFCHLLSFHFFSVFDSLYIFLCYGTYPV